MGKSLVSAAKAAEVCLLCADSNNVDVMYWGSYDDIH